MTFDMKTKLQQISDEAWIVQKGKQPIGILNKDVQNHFTFISGQSIEVFGSDNEVREHFGNITLFEEQIEKHTVKPDEFYIKGHAVDYPNPIPIEPGNEHYREDVPLYLKSDGSNVFYAAGWYCINFEKGWKQGHGPKLSTLLEYGFNGPFKTKIECKQQMKTLNKLRKLKG